MNDSFVYLPNDQNDAKGIMTAERNDGHLSGQVTTEDSKREEASVQETRYPIRFALTRSL